MPRFGADSQHNTTHEIELEPMLGKERSAPQLVALAEPVTRNGFIRKVYGILLCQLLATTLIGGLVVRNGRQLLHSNPSAVMTAVMASCILSLLLVGVFSCCPDVMRKTPGNYALLALLTVAESVMVGFACLQYTVSSVLLCLGLTAVVVLGLTIYALQTKNDLTTGGPYLFCCLLVLCGTGFILMVVSSLGLTHNPAFGAIQILYAGAGALVFSLFIVYDTQLIVGGQHQHEFNIDDYAMAAICMYLDILQLFLSLLRLIGRQDDGL